MKTGVRPPEHMLKVKASPGLLTVTYQQLVIEHIRPEADLI